MNKIEAYDASKRVFDIVASSAGLLLASPVIAGTYVLIRWKLGTPVLFRQERPGLNGQVFQLIKFRTMLNINEERGIITNEQRMTPLGRKLRAWSLDELPSLLNILRGDMSLVGPRPLLKKYLPLYSTRQAKRHDVRPGLTGLAQVNGRNALDWESRFEYDVYYVENRSFALDAKILVKTVEIALRRDGINSEGHVVGSPFEGPSTESSRQ